MAPLFGFQWNEAAIDRPIERGIFSVLARDRAGHMQVLGSGFVVASNGRLAMGCTAAHVLREIQRIRRSDGAHPSLPDILRPPAEQIDLALEGLTLVIADGDHLQFTRVLGLAFDERSDVALLQFERQALGERELDAEFLADDRLPAEGDLVSIVTYGNLRPGKAPDGRWTLARRPLARVGRVVHVHQEGFGLARVPSVETTIPTYHGMSGSVAFLHVEPGEKPRAFGFVSTDLDDDGPRKEHRDIAGRSILAKLPCRLLSKNEAGTREVEFAFTPTYGAGTFLPIER